MINAIDASQPRQRVEVNLPKEAAHSTWEQATAGGQWRDVPSSEKGIGTTCFGMCPLAGFLTRARSGYHEDDYTGHFGR